MGADLVRGTYSALASPRRLIPILIVAGPLVSAQWYFTRNLRATGMGVVMCVAFLAVAPLAWRALFPLGRPHPYAAVRLAAYALLGLAVIGGIGVGFAGLIGVGITFLSTDASLVIVLGLFWVGGWGLGRDIELETSLARERARAEAAVREAERAELMAIRSHLDPHFLFNTLNAIAEWCREDGEVAERALLQLSDMLRTVLSAIQAPTWSLARELELVASLVDLYRIRDGERFSMARSGWDDVDGLEVPPMLLLSLVENAFKHGPAAGHVGALRLAVTREDDGVRIVIENPGAFAGPREEGQGLDLVRRRLALACGDAGRFSIGAQDGWTRAELILPGGSVGGVLSGGAS